MDQEKKTFGTLFSGGELFGVGAEQAGKKKEEYRLHKEYWKKRINNNDFEFILLYLGYPKAGDTSKRIVCHYTGHEVKDIKHPEFGEKPVRVFALFVDRKVWG